MSMMLVNVDCVIYLPTPRLGIPVEDSPLKYAIPSQQRLLTTFGSRVSEISTRPSTAKR